MNFNQFLKARSKISNLPLPAEASQFKMSPPFRAALAKKQQDKIKFAKQSAVLALFYPDHEEETKLVLILRKSYKGVHSAQVGFPGGKVEETDVSLQHTALRETEEEVGMPMQDVKVIKALTQMYIPPSNFYVHPFIGYTDYTPNFVKEESEVEDILEVSLQQFLDDRNVVIERVSTSYNREVEVPAFKLNDHVVWGATAMMLSEIKDLLKQAL
ncbi:NUDIX domain-containing protein [Oceanihabitans sediminis]|uniref:CoA pyrophosphatase n=1 Tax=Oceanihabitans sediminis TaxID=1812012 RepID=A0A368P4B1_9FLAO|nr:CoA pyrophosphatase [Oceanihabitans sediminis]RBP30775.1 NUDIX domain-containing protein [Oceanihabitans sediminis]RCU56745.1 CoA pyrophosphatase [Oceanihabitans sediminis]